MKHMSQNTRQPHPVYSPCGFASIHELESLKSKMPSWSLPWNQFIECRLHPTI